MGTIRLAVTSESWKKLQKWRNFFFVHTSSFRGKRKHFFSELPQSLIRSWVTRQSYMFQVFGKNFSTDSKYYAISFLPASRSKITFSLNIVVTWGMTCNIAQNRSLQYQQLFNQRRISRKYSKLTQLRAYFVVLICWKRSPFFKHSQLLLLPFFQV